MSDSANLVTIYWTVGFTGHRDLSDPEKTAGAIASELAALAGKVQGKLAAVSSIASGGDILFAEEVLKIGLPWIALLPFPREEFAKDFKAADWARAERCLTGAVVEEVWSAVPDRPDTYHDVGIKTVDECDVLFAVWDGGPPDGCGGTADVVYYARQGNKPLIWIHAANGTVTHERLNERHLRDSLFGTLLALPDPPSAPASSLAGSLGVFFGKVDAAATHHLPQVRSLETRIVLFNSLAAFIAAFATAMQFSAFDFVTLTILPMSYALYLMSRLHFPKTRHKYVQARLAAEICRSIEATRDFPDRLTDLYRSGIPEFDHLMRSLLLARDIEKKNTPVPASIASFRARYLKDRIKDQRGYYERQRIKALPRAKHYTRVTIAASSAAVLATLLFAGIGLSATGFDPFPATFEFISHHFLHRGGVVTTVVPSSKPLSLLGISAPLIASFFTALLAVNEYKRRSARYHEMEQMLSTAEMRLNHARTPRAIKQVIVDTETALLGENYQWYYQAGK